MKSIILLAIVGVTLTACASGSAVRTSQNTAIIRASAAPVCGGIGAAAVAEKQAAIETLKSGFDRYIITGSASANNVSVSQTIGRATTYGTYNRYGYTAQTTFTPQTVVSGANEQSFSIVMFRNGEPAARNAIDAKTVLGENWEKSLKNGIMTCT